MTRIAFVVAYDRGRAIGKDNRLPWRLPDDMRHVRNVTMGKPMIMGRRTWDSIGRPLPGRTSIVLTRDREFRCDGCLVARTPEEAIKLAGAVPEIIVFGGARVFEEFLPRADRIYLTEVEPTSMATRTSRRSTSRSGVRSSGPVIPPTNAIPTRSAS